MNSIEERIRAATRAQAEMMRAVRPLSVPSAPGTASRRPLRARRARRARWWRAWLAPVAAALCVLAVGISLVLIKHIPNDSGATSVPPPAASGVPPYYVALPALTLSDITGLDSHAVVGDTFTGRQLTTLRAPAGEDFASVTAGPDDRTFVVGTRPVPAKGELIQIAATRWYLMRLTSGAKVTATMRELPVRVPETALAAALSPDGTRLAVASASGGLGKPGTKPTPLTLRLRIYSTATGAPSHEWSGTIPQWYDSISLLTWTNNGRQIAFDLGGSPQLEVRTLRVGNPGHGLFTDSRLAWSVPEPGTYYVTREHPFTCGTWEAPSPLITADGKTVVCGASSIFAKPTVSPDGGNCGGPSWSSGGILEYSAASGKLTRTLYRFESNCLPESAPGPVTPLWASGSGDTVLGYFNFGHHSRFGVIRQGTFTPLPVPSGAPAGGGSIAW